MEKLFTYLAIMKIAPNDHISLRQGENWEKVIMSFKYKDSPKHLNYCFLEAVIMPRGDGNKEYIIKVEPF